MPKISPSVLPAYILLLSFFIPSLLSLFILFFIYSKVFANIDMDTLFINFKSRFSPNALVSTTKFDGVATFFTSLTFPSIRSTRVLPL